MSWLANADIQPPTTLIAVLKYIGKYVSKPEKSSTSYTELQAKILPYTSDRAPLLSFVSKMLNKLISERDWSAQEVSHILLGLTVQDSSREVVTLFCRPDKEQQDQVTLEDGTAAPRRSPLQRYIDRVVDSPVRGLPEVWVFDWLTLWDWKLFRLRPRARARVINYYPKYDIFAFL